MIFRLNLFLKEAFLFSLTLLLGIFSAYNYAPLIEKAIIEPKHFSWDNIVIFMVFFAILSFFMLRFKKVGTASFKFFLLLVVFSGSQVIFGSVFRSPWDLVLAMLLVVIFIFIKNVAVHDFAIVLGIAGISSILGINISPITGIILLVILSFYDIVAVYWTKHMVALARGMMDSGAIFGFIIPFELKDFLYHSREAKAKMGEKFMVLGSGDIGLPLVMASSIAIASISDALVVGLFSILGLFLTHIIFINQKTRQPMAALPPIATLTIIGYLVTQTF